MASARNALVATITIDDVEPKDIRDVFQKTDKEFPHTDKKKMVCTLISELDTVKQELDQKCTGAGLASTLVGIINDQEIKYIGKSSDQIKRVTGKELGSLIYDVAMFGRTVLNFTDIRFSHSVRDVLEPMVAKLDWAEQKALNNKHSYLKNCLHTPSDGELQRKHLAGGGEAPSDEIYQVCALCGHNYVDCPASNRPNNTWNQQRMQKFQTDTEAFKADGQAWMRNNNTTRGPTDPMNNLRPVLFVCHCHQMQCTGSKHQKQDCPVCDADKCKQVDATTGKCACQICNCPCRAAVKVDKYLEIFLIMNKQQEGANDVTDPLVAQLQQQQEAERNLAEIVANGIFTAAQEQSMSATAAATGEVATSATSGAVASLGQGTGATTDARLWHIAQSIIQAPSHSPFIQHAQATLPQPNTNVLVSGQPFDVRALRKQGQRANLNSLRSVEGTEGTNHQLSSSQPPTLSLYPDEWPTSNGKRPATSQGGQHGHGHRTPANVPPPNAGYYGTVAAGHAQLLGSTASGHHSTNTTPAEGTSHGNPVSLVDSTEPATRREYPTYSAVDAVAQEEVVVVDGTGSNNNGDDADDVDDELEGTPTEGLFDRVAGRAINAMAEADTPDSLHQNAAHGVLNYEGQVRTAMAHRHQKGKEDDTPKGLKIAARISKIHKK